MELENPPSFDYGDRGQLVEQDDHWLSDGEDDPINSHPSGDNFNYEEKSSYLENSDAAEKYLDNDDEQRLTDEEIKILAEQIAVERELQQLKEEGFLPMEEPPEYDVKDRIAQLNAELAAEGTIPGNRKQSVQFRDDPVSDVFPVVYYEDDYEEKDDEESANETDGVGDSDQPDQKADDDTVDQEVAKLTLNDTKPGIERQTFIQREKIPKKKLSFSDTADETLNNTSKDSSVEEDKVVVERDGKFEVVDASDLSMEERYLMGLEPENKNYGNSLPNINNSGNQQSPPKQRPSTASNTVHERLSNPPKRRVQSARPVKKSFPYDKQQIVKKSDPFRDGTISDVGNEKSRYGLTQEQKEYQRKMSQLKRGQLREETQLKEEEERRNKSESEEAFHAWLQQKEDEARNKRKEEREKKKSESENDPNKPNPDEIFKSWVQCKKRQSNLEKRFHKQFEEESKQGQQQRSREECEKTYKAWVRSKNQQLREQQSLSRAHSLASKQQTQRSRKSQTLAKALQLAQTYRYTDYYGYRF